MIEPTQEMAPSAPPPALSPLKRAFLALEQAQARIAALESAGREPIAVIGLGCRVPGRGRDGASFWRLMRDGVDAISRVPSERFDIDALYHPDPATPGKIATLEGGFLEDPIDRFDAAFFGISPREAQGMDPQQRLLLEVSWEALEHAGQAPDRLERTPTGVYAAVCGSDYAYLQLETGDRSLLDAHFTSGIAHSVFSGRLSYLLGLQGPSLTVDTACSSSLVAVHLACQALRSGECRMALAGGVNLILAPDLYIALSHSRMLAPDGRCKTFDAAADGFARAEGCGVVVLKRLSDARSDGDRVLAVIRGSAVNQDGPSSGLTAPNGPAQEAVIREALARAGIAPRAVGYVEAHGTGTQLGDPLEMHALGAVFGPDRRSVQPLWVGSVKTNVGHLEAAAGVTGLIKLILALRNRAIPAHLHFRTPSPHIQWSDLAVRIPTELTPWEPIDGRRIGGVSSFGFSGTNAHIVVEEASADPNAADAGVAAGAAAMRRPHLFTLSARSPQALAELAARHGNALAERSDAELPDICHTVNVGRAHFGERAAIAARSVAELSTALAALGAGRASPAVVTASLPRRDPPRIAFLFTGQGAQYPGMARELYEVAPAFRAEVDRCARHLESELDRPLLDVMFASDQGSSVLDETAYTQPALFVLEYALAQLWSSWGVSPDVVIGHSVGEVVAACIAGVLGLEDALRLIARRGRLMQSLPAGGAMAAVNAPAARVAESLAPFATRVSIAAINGPVQTVISGEAASIAQVCQALATAGIRAKPLTVSHAFHSPLMEPILDRFESEVARTPLSAPRLRLISNLTGRVATAGEITTPSYWRRHVREPVRFGAGLETLAAMKPDCLIEIGPHPTLLSLAAAVFGEGGPRRIASLQKASADWEQMLTALGAAYLSGARIDWRAVGAGGRHGLIDLPAYPFQRERYWFRANRGASPVSTRGRSTGHALLGARLRSASADTIFEARVAADTPAFVRQHRVLGHVVMPAAAYLDTLLACAREMLRTDAVSIESIAVNEAMLLPDDGAARTMQTVCGPARDGLIAAAISSIADAEEERSEWTRHVVASLRAAVPAASDPPHLARLRAACPTSIEPRDFYAGLEPRGLDFGPGFKVMRSLQSGDLQALGMVELNADLAQEPGFVFHPVLLDGCLQVMAAALPPGDADALYLPIGIGRYTVHRRPAGRCWSHAALRAGAGETYRASVHVLDEQGTLLAELQDVQLKRVTRDALARLGERWLEDCSYEVRWREAAAAAPVRRDGTADSESATWLVFADRQGLADALAARLRARGEPCLLVTPGPFGLRSDSASVESGNAEHPARLLSALRAAGRSIRGVIHAGASDAPPSEMSSAAALEAARNDGVLSALHLAQALVSEPLVPPLWLVTRGAQAVQGMDRAPSAEQAALWGLSRALGTEHPELRSICVDLESIPAAGEIEALVQELDQPGTERQVAFRAGSRFVARLVRSPRGARSAAQQDGPGASWRLVAKEGSLEEFRVEPQPRRAPGAGEVEIEVRAAALNFKDVLATLGMYPGRTGLLGGECAGRVVAVGAGVTHVRPGDDVMAVAAGSFASHVLARGELVQLRPAGISAEQGAAFSIPYITAEFCLGHLAGMSRGQRVLIHAAAGGVGMAAVRLAQLAGADIFATAGSPWKRDLLRSMGVAHVYDSRSSAFAAEIMSHTGGRGVDIVLNSLAGDLIEASFAVLAPGGTFVEIGKRGIKEPAWVAAQGKGWRYFIVDWSETAASDPALIGGLYARLVEALREGDIPPLPTQSFPLEHAGAAFRCMAQARHAGKIVIRHGVRTPFAVRRDGTYLISGGLSGLGLHAARRLGELGAGRLVLLGRRGVTSEAMPVLEVLRAAGTEVIAEAVDIADERAVNGVLERVRAGGPPLRGVLHCAAVLDDGALLQQNAERFMRVFAPKVRGGRILDAATRRDPLDWFVLFSSAAAVLGSAGQANYTAANAFLDGLALERRSRGAPATSIAWGPWADAGMAADRGLIERMSRQGLAALSIDQGLLALQRAVESGAPQVMVAPIDWKVYFERVSQGVVSPFLAEVAGEVSAPASATSLGHGDVGAVDVRRQLADAPPARRLPMLVTFVRERALRVLGGDPARPLDPSTPLGDLGLDSLLAVELRNALSAALGQPLPATLLFDHPTVAAVTEYLATLLKIDGAPQSGQAAPVDEQSLLDRVERLSEDELDRLLASKMQGN
jgi:acyl transferase domain-containing protein/NADPH:quinone reductase-like Zn-dependent oxidoreductase/acyl carrier protein/short-subunit dehydrogenase